MSGVVQPAVNLAGQAYDPDSWPMAFEGLSTATRRAGFSLSEFARAAEELRRNILNAYRIPPHTPRLPRGTDEP